MPTYRLRNRNVNTPVGFLFMQPQMNWDASRAVPGATLQGIARAVLELRKANPYVTQKHGLSTDLATIMDEVDAYTATVCALRGFTNYITGNEPPKPLPLPAPSRFAAAVEGVKRVAAGVGVLLSWLGSGAKPVEKTLAESRARVCATCPQNGAGDWKARFTGEAAEQIKQQLGIKNDLKLSTPLDGDLRVCLACDCQLQLKVWCPLEHILKHTSDETKSRLDPRCWLISEEKALTDSQAVR